MLPHRVLPVNSYMQLAERGALVSQPPVTPGASLDIFACMRPCAPTAANPFLSQATSINEQQIVV